MSQYRTHIGVFKMYTKWANLLCNTTTSVTKYIHLSFKKGIFWVGLNIFFVSGAYSQFFPMEAVVEPIRQVKGTIIPPEMINIFFEKVLLSDKVKSRPSLENLNPENKPTNLRRAIRNFHKYAARDHKRAIKGLRHILTIYNIQDKNVLNRILLDVYQEIPFEQRFQIYKEWQKTQKSDLFYEFLKYVEEFYFIGSVDSSKRKAIHLFHQILQADTIGRKEIRLLRKALSHLGLPAHIHHDDFLKMYLLDLKNQQVKAENESFLKIRDKDMLKLVERTKTFFDDRHFNNLQEMTKFKNIIRGFPLQYLIFQAAIGAMIYRSHITDPLAYRAHTKPGYLEEFMKQSLTPSSVVSFFIFIVVSQKSNYLFYKAGRHFDKKFLKTMAPHIGLASGFFISALATELYQDQDFRLCVKTLMSKKTHESESEKHISACEKSYTKWLQSKWSDYAVDIVSLLGASWMSHKMIQTILIGIRATSKGGFWLSQATQRLGPRVTGLIGFFITIYVFMESHKLLDQFIGKPVKSYLKIDSIQSDIFRLNHSHRILKVKTSEQKSSSQNEITQVVDDIKLIGRRFNDWFLLKVQDYQWSFSLWLKKTNKVTLFYQQSREMLSNLYKLSNSSYDFNIAVMSLESLPRNKGFLIDRDIFHNNREHYYNIFCSDELIQKLKLVEWAKVWPTFCSDPENANIDSDDLVRLGYESVFMIYELLKGTIHSGFDFVPYISKNPEEIFASNSQYSLNHLSLTQRLQFVQSVFQDIFDSQEEAVTQIWTDRGYDAQCVEEYSTEEEQYLCKVDTYSKLLDKILASALFVLKEIQSDRDGLVDTSKGHSDSSGLLGHTRLEQFLGFNKYQKMHQLLELFQIYRKGEIFFKFQVNHYDFLKKQMNQIGDESEVTQIQNYPYAFFRALICGSTAEKWNEHFIAPHLFKELAYLCTNFYSKVDYVRFFHKDLFEETVEKDGREYNNLWFLLEHYVGSHFKSEQDLLDAFEEQSKSQIQHISKRHLTDLQNVTKNYMMPNMVNPKVRDLKSCDAITSHYNEKNLRSLTLTGLEISLFQVIYWLQRLEMHYGSLDSKCDLIEIFKSYHDSYLLEEGPFLLIPEDDNWSLLVLEKGLGSLKEAYPTSEIPVLLNSNTILSLIMKEGSGAEFSALMLYQLQSNTKAFEGEDQVAYALLFELKLALDNFFQQLNFLNMKHQIKQSLNL